MARLVGRGRLDARLNALGQRVEQVDRALLKGGLIIAAEAQRNVSGGGTSRRILNVRSGRLRSSLTAVPERPGAVTVGTNVVYGPIHEFGGFAGRNLSARIPARPYLSPAFKRKRAEVFRIVRQFYTGPLSIRLI